jgi:hypothetical protein
MTQYHNIHALLHDLFHSSLFIPNANKALILSNGVLQPAYTILYHMIDARLLLQL